METSFRKSSEANNSFEISNEHGFDNKISPMSSVCTSVTSAPPSMIQSSKIIPLNNSLATVNLPYGDNESVVTLFETKPLIPKKKLDPFEQPKVDFHACVKVLLKEKEIEPGVNVFFYEDPYVSRP